MFPLAHIFVSTEVTSKKSPLLVFGSVLPDISWTSESEIARDEIHYAPKKLYMYISKHCPKFIDLALGVRLHSNVDKGADYYSDDKEIGFAYGEGAKIEPEVSRLLRGEGDKKSLVLAHNFVEAAVDLNLLDDSPEILRLYKNSIKKVDFESVSMCLANYLKLDKEIVQSEIKKFLNLIGPKAYASEKIMVGRITLLISKRMGVEVDNNDVSRILKKTKELMKDKYQGYLTEAIEKISSDFAELV